MNERLLTPLTSQMFIQSNWSFFFDIDDSLHPSSLFITVDLIPLVDIILLYLADDPQEHFSQSGIIKAMKK